MQILVIEDDEDIRSVLVDAIEQRGHKAAGVADGNEALRLLSSLGADVPCLMVVDLMMPGMNGWELIDALRKNDKYLAIPMVITTASPAHRWPEGYRILKKPFALDALLEEVDRHCHPLKDGGPVCSPHT